MEKEICTIFIGNGILDNDFTFYESGKIKRLYDRNAFRYNIEEWVESKDISSEFKKKLLENCPPGDKEKIAKFLN